MTQRIPTGYCAVALQLKHTLLTRPALITLGLDVSAVDMTSSGIRDGIGAAVRALVSPQMDESVTVGPVTFRVGPYPPEAVIYVDPDTVAGARSGQSPPPATALLVNLQTSRGGRRGRGRLFIPWAVDRTDISEGGIVGSTSLGLWQTAMDDGLAAFTAADVPWVVLHTFNESTSESPDIGGAPNAVIGATVQSLISTQRRRLGR